MTSGQDVAHICKDILTFYCGLGNEMSRAFMQCKRLVNSIFFF